MGICLDTEQSNGSQLFDEQNSRAGWNDDRRFISTPPDGQFPMHNGGTVQFEPPRVPVIFVLGGPGSGKVTHCDNLMQEKRGIVHINMTDLLQQYAIGNDGEMSIVTIEKPESESKDMQDFSQLSSKTVTEVLMLEMKMAPNAKTYLVSGYPRNMRDVVEYSDKIQVVNGAVMISWRQKILERQIDYGAKLGQVVLSLARMELNNFYKNVMPVAEYFDQSGMLIAVNGERHPGEVYKDFRSSIMKILGTQNNPPALTNGRAAVITDEPDLVAPQKAPQQVPLAVRRAVPPLQPLPINTPPPQDVITVRAHDTTAISPPTKPGWPSVIWVIGGPGSNKAVLCSQSVRNIPGWVHISVGKLLRDSAEPTAVRPDTKIIRQCITAGDMVPPNIVMQLLETHLGANMSTPGVVLDGYPRDLKQINEFEVKFKQKPHLVLLDCSKLQLGRGRLDDSVSAFRRRLELFRELTLPMLKSLDSEGRLTIVDGDTDSTQVQEEFNKVIRQQIKEQQDQTTSPNNEYLQRRRGTIVEDLDAITGLETISKRVSEQSTSMANGISNGIKGKMMANGGLPKQPSYVNNTTGNIPNGVANGGPLKNKVTDMYTSLANQRRENIKNMYNDGNNYF